MTVARFLFPPKQKSRKNDQKRHPPSVDPNKLLGRFLERKKERKQQASNYSHDLISHDFSFPTAFTFEG
jgi:hypothetical protein